MSDLYDDAMVTTATVALLGFDPHWSTHDAWAASIRRCLDAVAPAIAARALRESADLPDPTGQWSHACSPLARRALLARADEIEAGQ